MPHHHPAIYVALSLLIAILGSCTALDLFQRARSHAGSARRVWLGAAAGALGVSVWSMHVIAMLGFNPAAPSDGAAIGVAAVAALLSLTLAASLYEQRRDVLAALDAGDVGYWELALPSRVLHVSSQGRRLLGLTPGAPFGVAELLALAEPAEPARRAQLEAAIEAGLAYDLELRAPDPDGTERWLNVRGRVLERASGRRMVGVVFDVTARHEAVAQVADSERRQQVLIDELNHRVKNTLAAVQSISRQSAKRAGSVSDFRELFEARLIALSQTHNALTRQSWERAHLDELLHQQLDPYPSNQVVLEGPAVDLAPREALALGMVFHELAANAAKYGGLSSTGGQVRVAWEVIPGGPGQQLRMDWRETGGPVVTEPVRRGFGVRMVQGAVMGELGGGCTLSFEPGGFRAELSIPLDFSREAAADEPNLKPGVQHGFSAASAK